MTAERKSGIIIAAIALLEGGWVAMNLRVNGWRFVRYLGFSSGAAGNVAAWIAAFVVAIVFIGLAARLPSVRQHLLRLDLLKLLALLLAASSGVLEEVMFRRWTMNWLLAHNAGAVLQVLGSGLLFGALHAVWGLFGKSVRAAIGGMLATTLLGLLLGLVFILAGRSLAPCIAAHFLINLFVEPGLVLAAVRGEMHAATLS